MKTKKNYLTVIVTILFVAGIWVLSGCGNSENKQNVNHQNEAAEGEHQHDTDEQHKHGDITTSEYQCPMKCEGEKTYDKASSCPVCNMNLKKLDAEVVHYQCPMKCEGDKTYNNPGNCPECKMKLKKTTNDHKG